MGKNNIKLVPSIQATVARDESVLSLLEAMDAKGHFSLDQFKTTDNQAGMDLNPQEINMLRLIGIQVIANQVLLRL